MDFTWTYVNRATVVSDTKMLPLSAVSYGVGPLWIRLPEPLTAKLTLCSSNHSQTIFAASQDALFCCKRTLPIIPNTTGLNAYKTSKIIFPCYDYSISLKFQTENVSNQSFFLIPYEFRSGERKFYIQFKVNCFSKCRLGCF